MKKDLFHYFDADVPSVYTAYLKAAKEKFGKECNITSYHTISFRITYSVKYNIDGGICNIHFIPYESGTAIGIRYTIPQLFGARYEAHCSDMICYVEKELKTQVKSINVDKTVYEQFKSCAWK